VRHGLGISCLSRRVIAEQLEAGTLVEIPVPLPKLVRTLWCIHHRQKHLSSSLQRFYVIARSEHSHKRGEGKTEFILCL
jgi:DNA-binding transcriptional LysR family regulator